jgi:hypothetical protein
MKSMTIKTDAGDLELVPATIDQLRGLAHYWPMELLQNVDPPGSYGLVFQHDEEEIEGIKMQTVDVAKADAVRNHHVYRILIAAALPHYLEKQHRGVMVPCAYYKEKASGLAEAGIAFFVGPDPASKPSVQRAGSNYDDRLGEGATQMVMDMIGAIGKAMQKYDLPPITLIGLDVRPRLMIGSIVIHFVIQGSEVIAAKDQKVETDPVWEHVVRAGFSTLPYAPMTPTGLPGRVRADIRHI